MKYRAPISDYIQKSTFKKYILAPPILVTASTNTWGIDINGVGDYVKYIFYIPPDALSNFDISILYASGTAQANQNVTRAYSYGLIDEDLWNHVEFDADFLLPCPDVDILRKFSVKSLIVGVTAGCSVTFKIGHSATVPATNITLKDLVIEYNI